jgi:hypothetical protein
VKKWDWLLIGCGAYCLFVSVPTMTLFAWQGWALPSVEDFAAPAIGVILIVSGVFLRGWRERWRRR